MPANVKNHTEIGHGSVTNAFYSRTERNGSLVFKVVRATTRHNETGASAAQIANEMVWGCEYLRTHPLIVANFGHVVPRTWSPRAGIIAQERGVGVAYKTFPVRLIILANEDMYRWKRFSAQAFAGKAGTDVHEDNFLFDPNTGKISCAFDPVFPFSAMESIGGYTAPRHRPA